MLTLMPHLSRPQQLASVLSLCSSLSPVLTLVTCRDHNSWLRFSPCAAHRLQMLTLMRHLSRPQLWSSPCEAHCLQMLTLVLVATRGCGRRVFDICVSRRHSVGANPCCEEFVCATQMYGDSDLRAVAPPWRCHTAMRHSCWHSAISFNLATTSLPWTRSTEERTRNSAAKATVWLGGLVLQRRRP